MNTIEEILERNEKNVSEVSANIRYKEILTPAVMNYINFVNDTMKMSKDEPGFVGLIQHLKLIIGGGAAFNYYIKSVEKTNILTTHDFDLRLYLDIPPSTNPLFGKEAAKIENWMTQICKEIGKSFANFLNDYVKTTNIKQQLKNENIDITNFRMVDHGFLTTIEYLIRKTDDDFNDSLIDIVPHVKSKAIHYDKLEIDKKLNFKQYEERDSFNVMSRQGFFKSSIVYTKTKYGIYYVSLGFLVWDTVRMINYIIDSKLGGHKKRPVILKFERYLYKYKILLSALSRPELYLSCEAVDKFINKCSKIKQVCEINNQKVESKEELIYKGVEAGVFPNDVYWYKELMQMDFTTICKSVIEVLQ